MNKMSRALTFCIKNGDNEGTEDICMICGKNLAIDRTSTTLVWHSFFSP